VVIGELDSSRRQPRARRPFRRGDRVSSGTDNAAWAAAARRVFAAHPSMATVSIVSRELASTFGYQPAIHRDAVQASCAALPVCFINDAARDLLRAADLRQQIEAATLRGLHHAWVVVADGGATTVAGLVPSPAGDRIIIAALPRRDAIDDEPPIALGIDAAWLLDGESGAQVFVFEMLRAMAVSPAIARIVLLSDGGGIPTALTGVAKISGRTWTEALAADERLDVMHRPYQPGADTDFQRYRRVARAVAVTILDFIAYDNPAYHESAFAFRRYQRGFDARVCDADQVFAISRHIGDRIQRQFAHHLLAPVGAIHLGTDHLDARHSNDGVPAPLQTVRPKKFLVVLGNDFAHKNRDFAVNVFAEMCRRGYTGHLVLAGFHLDAGSSFDYELAGAGAYADRVLRLGSLPPEQKTWLLRHAECVLYPTSSEGFGLIPFEAAALGTPTAFVRFGPLAETMPDVPAAAAWDVQLFVDHVFSLLADPARTVAAINAAREPLTWQRCADETIAVYRDMLSDRAAWHDAIAGRRGPGTLTGFSEMTAEYWRRARGRIRRLTRVRRGRKGQQ
jgi:glycosyltransferase involved in cell wall biosynthesis